MRSSKQLVVERNFSASPTIWGASFLDARGDTDNQANISHEFYKLLKMMNPEFNAEYYSYNFKSYLLNDNALLLCVFSRVPFAHVGTNKRKVHVDPGSMNPPHLRVHTYVFDLKTNSFRATKWFMTSSDIEVVSDSAIAFLSQGQLCVWDFEKNAYTSRSSNVPKIRVQDSPDQIRIFNLGNDKLFIPWEKEKALIINYKTNNSAVVSFPGLEFGVRVYDYMMVGSNQMLLSRPGMSIDLFWLDLTTLSVEKTRLPIDEQVREVKSLLVVGMISENEVGFLVRSVERDSSKEGVDRKEELFILDVVTHQCVKSTVILSNYDPYFGPLGLINKQTFILRSDKDIVLYDIRNFQMINQFFMGLFPQRNQLYHRDEKRVFVTQGQQLLVVGRDRYYKYSFPMLEEQNQVVVSDFLLKHWHQKTFDEIERALTAEAVNQMVKLWKDNEMPEMEKQLFDAELEKQKQSTVSGSEESGSLLKDVASTLLGTQRDKFSLETLFPSYYQKKKEASIKLSGVYKHIGLYGREGQTQNQEQEQGESVRFTQ